MRELMSQILCGWKGHWLEHQRNIHGDEINYRGGKRSVWKCRHCGAVKLRDHLYNESKEPANV